ncbi:MAG: DUF2185 domain-containing protein [Micromonosporaceae bacterium]|nr:DUF2185 domain-containing protein [Micromonosporaceae bacterium]
MSEPMLLGEINTPSGALVVLDPGLSRFWRHDGDPRSPRRTDGEEIDIGIVGPDAVAAGRAYDHEFDPRYLFDIPVDLAEQIREQFNAFAAEHRFNARAERLSERVSHVERARLAVEIGGGIGVVTYNRLWAVACRGLPLTGALPVLATPMPDGEFTGRWRCIDVVVMPGTEVVTTEPVQGVMVEHGQLICADLDALGEFRMGESLDGLGDFVFWGADAASAAEAMQAAPAGDREFGWVNVAMAELDAVAERTRGLIAEHRWRVAVDYRPHDNLERLNAQVRVNETRAGSVLLGGAQACGFDNRWGDGIFTVSRGLSRTGELVRIRLDVGDEQTQRRMRWVWLMACRAIVSRLVWDDQQPPRFIERQPATRPEDSGWRISSGGESDQYMEDSANFRLIQVRQLIDRYPMFKAVVEAEDGSLFHLEDDRYVPD